MGADVRIVRLIRKTIFGEKGLPDSSTQGLSEYFVTDYFDTMRVEKGDVNASFTSMLGILQEDMSNGVDIADHGFSLYCSDEVMELEKKNNRCSDPFQTTDKKMPFLSIIQVHILPEVMARMPKEESAEQFILSIYQDLHMAMIEYGECKEHQSERFVFRIYKMLSVGDFAIVVRSGNEEISFGISSYLRRRILGNKTIVLYKTYTIFTLGDEIIECNFDGQSDVREDRFVLRCCFSNLYWRDREIVYEYLEQEGLSFDDRPYGLNGRYDFSVRVTRKQFLELLPDIRKYKETGRLDSVENSVGKKGSAVMNDTTIGQGSADDIVKYMRYLMKNRYLSYINERYLVAQDDRANKLVKNNFSIVNFREEERPKEVFLDEKIRKLYQVVKGNYEYVCGEINSNVTYLKNIWYYMGLLGKQIDRYYGISGFSDTRVYAIMLLKQIDVTVGLINEYVGLYKAADDERGSEESEKGAILNRLEDDIREAVCALDSYAQYIRNRNLQSLQTPNYNLESEMSLEKILIGYSEFIKTFMDFYPKWGKLENSEWFPVVVPRLKEKDVSVRRLFPQGMMNDWEKEKEIHGKRRRKCDFNSIVISVPIIAKLGNVETMATSLIHEMAHQFRYELRKERNDALLTYLIHNVMKEITYDVIQKIMDETGTIEYYYKFGKLMAKILTDVYLDMNYTNKKQELEYSFQEAPLSNFEYCFRNDLYETFGGWEKKNQLRDVLYVFLKKLLQYNQGEDSQLLEAVEVMDGLIQNAEKSYHSKNVDENGENLYEQIVRCAYGLSWMCAWKRSGRKASYIWEKKGFQTWVREIDLETAYEDIWSDAYSEDSPITATDDGVGDIYKNFRDFSIWIYLNCGNTRKAKDYENAKKKKFLEEAHNRLCKEWETDKIQEALLTDDDSHISLIGRSMGIDCNSEENFEIFKRRITVSVVRNLEIIAEKADWRIDKYREETADIFMCNAMELTPFGYMYLLASEWLCDRQLPQEYYSRSQNVLLFQWCLKTVGGEKRLSYSQYRKECRKMADTLEEAIRTTTKLLIWKCKRNSKRKGSKLLDEFPAFKEWKEKEDPKLLQLSDQIGVLANYCNKVMGICKNVSEKELYEKLKLYGIMANMLKQLIFSAVEHISYMNEFSEIRDDYIRGAEKLKRLNSKMRRSAIGHKDESGRTMINKVGEFCREIGRWQNEPCLLLENEEERIRRNICSTEFLLNMYYENRRRVVWQIGGEECLTNKRNA